MINRRTTLKLILGVPLTITMGASTTFAQTLWRQARSMPFKTQEIYPTLHQNRIYVAGGIAARLNVPYFTDRCVAFDPSTNKWSEQAPLPEPRHHAALVSSGDRLFQIGGFHGAYTHVWRMQDSVFELGADGWTPTTSLPYPQAEGVATFGPDDCIHVVTGLKPKGNDNSSRSDHIEINDHWVWDRAAQQWKTAAPIPTPRNSASGVWIGSKLVIVGGRTAAGNLATTEIYDVKSDSWEQGKPMPLPQAGTAAISIDNGMVVFGGEIFFPQSKVFKEVWHYELLADQWRALPPMYTPRHGLGAVKFGSQVYVVGGATKPGGSGTSNLNETIDLTEYLHH